MVKVNIPEHIAIIMDGNGRWAEKQNRERTYGHFKGEEVFRQICIDSSELGIKYLTVYAFSTENFKRSSIEVNTIFDILKKYFDTYLDMANKYNFRIKIIGRRDNLDKDFVKSINKIEKYTQHNKGLNVQIAVNYGGQDEIIRAVNSVLCSGKNGITSEEFSKYLDMEYVPAPDLLIRTGGERRLSNFLLWELAYTELYFTDILWPDFNLEELNKAIKFYNRTERKYGGVLTSACI